MPSDFELANMFDDTKWGELFSRRDVETIARHLSLHTYEPGDQIFSEGDKENYMAFIVEGHIEILKESGDLTESILVTLGPRTHFGEMAFIDDEPRSASATARDKVTLLVLSKEHFENILTTDPPLGITMLKNIARLISQRLRSTTGKLVYLRV